MMGIKEYLDARQKNVEMGIMEKTPDGYILTELGWEMMFYEIEHRSPEYIEETMKMAIENEPIRKAVEALECFSTKHSDKS